MRILYFHQYVSTRKGSCGTWSYEFARLLREGGHEITVLCGKGSRSGLPFQMDTLIDKRERDGLKVLEVNVPCGQRVGRVRRLIAFIRLILLARGSAAQRNVDAASAYRSLQALRRAEKTQIRLMRATVHHASEHLLKLSYLAGELSRSPPILIPRENLFIYCGVWAPKCCTTALNHCRRNHPNSFIHPRI